MYVSICLHQANMMVIIHCTVIHGTVLCICLMQRLLVKTILLKINKNNFIDFWSLNYLMSNLTIR